MKQSIFTKMILGALFAASLGMMTACAKTDSSSGVRVAGRGGEINTAAAGDSVAVQNNSATCSNGQTGTGTLSASNDAILALVSATISPQEFQGICKTNFSAALSFDSSGNIIAAKSSILIQIVDGLVGTVINGKTIQPYEIQFANAVSGVYQSNGYFQATFSDNYGQFYIQGNIAGATASGTVSFQNSVAVAGYQPASGNLGTFTMPASLIAH